MTRAESLARLLLEADHMNADELRVLTKFAKKIRAGADKHGHMDLRRDKRDWHKEQQDERVDDACYGYMAEVQAEIWAEDIEADPIIRGLRATNKQLDAINSDLAAIMASAPKETP